MKVKFTVLGEPAGKGRPRFTQQGRTYTPEKTATYENLVKLEYERQCGQYRFPDDAQIDVRITAYFGIPKSTSKKKKWVDNGYNWFNLRKIKNISRQNDRTVLQDRMRTVYGMSQKYFKAYPTNRPQKHDHSPKKASKHTLEKAANKNGNVVKKFWNSLRFKNSGNNFWCLINFVPWTGMGTSEIFPEEIRALHKHKQYI